MREKDAEAAAAQLSKEISEKSSLLRGAPSLGIVRDSQIHNAVLEDKRTFWSSTPKGVCLSC